jgi:hypothetical protein
VSRPRLILAAALGLLGLAVGAGLLYSMLGHPQTTPSLATLAQVQAPATPTADGKAASTPAAVAETPEEAQKILSERLQTLGSSCGDVGADEKAIRVPRSSSVVVTVLGGTSDDRGRIQHELEAFVRGDDCLRIAPIHVWSDRASPAYLKGAAAAADRRGLEVVAFVDAGATESVYIYDHDIRRALGEVVTMTRFAKTPTSR